VTLDPRWSFFLGLFITILAYLGGIAGLLTDAGLDAVTTHHFTAYVLITFGLLSTVNTYLAAIPSKPGNPNFYLGPKPPTDPAAKP
jgi:hypothetical protein